MAHRKYTTQELVEIYDRKDWVTLWKIITPMVKHAVRRCMQEGLDPFYVRDDLMQEAYARAWEALPRWNPRLAGLQTWVRENVRIAVTDTNRRERSGMIGGRDSGPLVVSMHGETPEEDGGDDEQGVLSGPEASMVYKDPPEGFGDPNEAADDLLEDLLSQVPSEDRDMVRRLCGIKVPSETQAEYALKEGISRRTVVGRLESLRQYFCAKSQKPANHVMTGQQTRRRAK